jgi:hypothetical protein
LREAIEVLAQARDDVAAGRPIGDPSEGDTRLARRMREVDWTETHQGLVDVLCDLQGICIGCATRGAGLTQPRQQQIEF